MTHTISVVHVQGCGGAVAALQIASGIAQARSDVRVEDVLVEDWAQGVEKGLRGSPTVLIDGHDIEPDSRVPAGSTG